MNILSFACHERSQSYLSSLPHTFYLYRAKGIKDWNYKFAPLPKNHIILNGDPNEPPSLDQLKDLKIQLAWSQSKDGQAQIAQQVSNALSIPWINTEHTLPFPLWTNKRLEMSNKIRADLNTFVTTTQQAAWKWEGKNDTYIIPSAVDTDFFSPDDNVKKEGKVMVCCNDYRNRSWCCGFDIYQRIMVGLPSDPVGDTPGFSKAAENPVDLLNHYRRASVFLNTSTVSTFPVSLLESLSCGIPTVSTAHYGLDSIIEDGVTGFASNNETILRERLNYVLKNYDSKEMKDMGTRAREMVKEKFSVEKQLIKWQEVFNRARGTAHH